MSKAIKAGKMAAGNVLRVDRKARNHIWSALFILPALTLFLLFTYYPLIQNVLISFTSWNGMTINKTYIGLDNFIRILSDKTLIQSVGNTFYLAGVLLIAGLVFQLSSALIVFSKVKGHQMIKLILYLPVVLSPIVISYSWIQFIRYPGYINQVLTLIGQSELRRDWLMNQDTVKLVLAAIQTLQYTGYGMIFFLTGLNSVPQDLYEVAELDGCRGIRKFFRLTLPLIMPSVTVTLFISITGALNTFALPFALTGGGPNGASTTIATMIYKRAFGMRQFGYGSAIGILFFFLIAAITTVQLRVTRRKEIEY